jgi:Fe2+ or Zn2+ uptake regulation protein
VYRVLETLVQTGVIAKACHPGAAARYDALMRRHHHLVCLHCEKVMDLEDARYDALPMPQIKAGKFEITDYCVHFRGICADCRAKDKTMSPAHSVAGRQTPRTAARPTHTRARNRRNTT